MGDCTGAELLTEVFSQLRMTEHLPELIRDSTCIPCMMPYITSHFMPRVKGDRPAVVPVGSTNLAFVGQFSDLPDDTVFTVEYSVRSAMVAVYTLLGIDRPIPALYKGYRDVNVLINAAKTAIR
jgi:oleate hydratase